MLSTGEMPAGPTDSFVERDLLRDAWGDEDAD